MVHHQLARENYASGLSPSFLCTLGRRELRDFIGSDLLGPPQLQAFDGSLMPRMYLINSDPTLHMYPTKNLTIFA